MVMQIQCPHCQARLHVAEKLRGQEATCPACRQRFKVSPSPEKGFPPAPKGSQDSSAGLLSPQADVPAMPSSSLAPGEAQISGFPGAGVPSVSAPAGGFPSDLPPLPSGMPSTSPEKHSAEKGPLQPVHRPFGIVWIVGYWILCWAIPFMVLGGALAASTFLPGLWIEIMSEIERNRSSGAVRIARLGVELVSLLGIWIFHYGLVTLVGCYGLWNLSKWGLVYSRVLSIANSIFAGLGLLVVIILGIPGITASLVTTVICIFIVLYLYAIIPSWNRWRIYFRQIQERTTA